MANLPKDGKANDTGFMQLALQEARLAAEAGEVPIGAVAVVEGQVVARAFNMREATHNPLGPAEILLRQHVSEAQGRWRLSDVTIYVTCEPCLMCMGAMLQARIPRVVYGCKDPKAGACGSLYDVSNDPRLNHAIQVTAGVLEGECGKLLSDFFRAKRK
jgi:tRNA(adenine34) deaminase